MPIYPSNNYDNLIQSSVLAMNNITEHREVVNNSNVDGTGKLTPTSLLFELYYSTMALYTEFYNMYLVGGVNAIGGDSTVTGPLPSVSNKQVDYFANLKQIKLRRLQTQCKLIGFEIKRMAEEINVIKSANLETIPANTTFIYPSSQRSPNPSSGW